MKPLRRFDPFQEGMRVDHIWIDTKSRDDIPRLLRSVRDLYLNEWKIRDAVFGLLEAGVAGDGRGRSSDPEMSLWTILVLSLLKRRLGCNFARICEHANTHVVLRELLGHGTYDPAAYSYDAVVRDVSLLDEDILRAIRYCDSGSDDHQGRFRHSPSHHGSGKSVSNWRFALWTAYRA